MMPRIYFITVQTFKCKFQKVKVRRREVTNRKRPLQIHFVMHSEFQRLDYRHVPKVANQTEHRHWSPKGCFASSTILIVLLLILRGTTRVHVTSHHTGKSYEPTVPSRRAAQGFLRFPPRYAIHHPLGHSNIQEPNLHKCLCERPRGCRVMLTLLT